MIASVIDENTHDNCVQIKIDKLKSVIKEQDNWVNVNDKLPNDGDIVLVYRNSYKHGDMVCTCGYSKDTGFVNLTGMVGKTDKITYWQPLPQPPKEHDNV
nr:DUF551 domain-containing protein [uncultured Moraxella sp.]